VGSKGRSSLASPSLDERSGAESETGLAQELLKALTASIAPLELRVLAAAAP
jgi:hypothetical protein